MNAHVHASTREHNTASKEIARSTENITAMIRQIKQACTEQSACSGTIVAAMENISRSTGGNLQATGQLTGAVAGLSSQVEVLQREMAGFKTG